MSHTGRGPRIPRASNISQAHTVTLVLDGPCRFGKAKAKDALCPFYNPKYYCGACWEMYFHGNGAGSRKQNRQPSRADMFAE